MGDLMKRNVVPLIVMSSFESTWIEKAENIVRHEGPIEGIWAEKESY